jgi:hypothetical protein
MSVDKNSAYEQWKRSRLRPIDATTIADKTGVDKPPKKDELLPQPRDDTRQPLYAITKKRKKPSATNGTEEDYNDLTLFLGYRPQSVTIVDQVEGIKETSW